MLACLCLARGRPRRAEEVVLRAAEYRCWAGRGRGRAGPLRWARAGSARGGPLIDHRHVRQPVAAALPGPAVRLAAAPGGPKHLGPIPAQPAQFRPVDRLVDRLVREVPPGVVRELAAQRVADLLRAPPPL